jgi:PKD repeat protein
MLNNLFLTINHLLMKNRQFTIIPFLRIVLLLVLCQAFVNKSWAQTYPDTSTWKVDLNTFQNTADVQGILIIEGFESTDPNDRVAAFKGSECRGVTNQLVEINNRFYAFITLGTNALKDTVEFFVYDASLGKVLPCPNKLTFTPFEFIGDVLNTQPYPIETFNVQITFKKGDVLCTADNYGYAKANVVGGNGPYQYKWSNGATTDSIGRLTAGKYILTITDANAVKRIDSITIVNLNRPIKPPVLLRTPDRPLCGGDDVFVTAYTEEKESPVFRWFNGFNQLMKVGPILTLKTVEDSLVVYCEVIVRNCVSARDSIEIFVEPLPNPSFSFDPFGYVITRREIKFTPDVKYPARFKYKYFWDFGDGDSETTTSVTHTYRVPGIYKVNLIIETPSGCSRSSYRFINIAGFDFVKEIDVLFNITDVQCASDKTGEITAQAINGTAPYRYKWSTGATTATISNLKPSLYGLTVTDSDGAVRTTEAKVRNRIDSVTSARPILGDSIICPGKDIWLAGTSSQANATFYWFEGADANAKLIYNGNPLLIFDIEKSRTLWLEARIGTCTQAKRTRVEIKVPEIALAVQASKSIVATGEEIGFSIPVQTLLDDKLYSWDFGDGSPIQKGISIKHQYNRSGLFVVTLTLQTPQGCVKQVTKVISVLGETKQGLDAILETKPGLCPEDATASIKVIIKSGVGPYSYQWNNGASTAELSGQLSGKFTVLITDLSNGQSVERSTQIAPLNDNLPSPLLIVNGNETICPGSAAWVLGSVDLPDAKISWYDSPVSGNLLFVGNVLQIDQVLRSRTVYAETVLGGCRSAKRSSATIAALDIDATFLVDPKVAPLGTNFSFNPARSNPAYAYIWTFGDTGVDTGRVANHTFSQTGLFEVELNVLSSQGCKVNSKQVVRVTQSGFGLDAALNVVFPKCAADSNGVITVKVLTGTSPFAYSWSNGATTQSIAKLKVGTYRVTVTDQTGKSWTEQVELNSQVPAIQLPAVTVNGNQIVCAGENIFAVALTNVADAEYRWYDQTSGGNLLFNGPSFPLLQVSKGLVLHVEAFYQGCLSPGRQNVPIKVNSPETSFYVSETVIKAGASVNIGPNVIVASNTYQWDFGDGTSLVGTQLVHKYDVPGTYQIKLTVVDPQGCTSSATRTVFVVSSVSLDVALDVVSATCNGKNDGLISARVFNGKAPYAYRWNNGIVQSEIKNAAPGLYEVTVTDNEGSTVVQSILMKSKIPELLPPEVRMEKGDQVCFGTKANLNAYSTLSGNLIYRWFDSASGGKQLGTGNTFSTDKLESGLSLFVEIEKGGCISTGRAKADVKVINPEPSFTVDKQNVVEGGEIKFEPTAKNTSWAYAWVFEQNGLSQSMIAQNRFLTKGEFDVQLTVTTPEGCTRSVQMEDYVNVISATELDVAVIAQGTICDTDKSGGLSAEAYNGSAPFTYKWSNGATTTTLQNVPSGLYTLTLTDRNGKQVVKTKKVGYRYERPKRPAINITSPVPICAGSTLQLKSLVGAAVEKIEWKSREKQLIGTKDTLNLPNIKDFVRIFLRTGNGVCFSDEASIELNVQEPNADFSVQPLSNISIGDTLQFLAQSQNLKTYEWSFGEGTGGLGRNAQHIFSTAGSFDVTLKVIDQDGCRGISTKKGLISVTEPLPLVAKFVSKGVNCAADTSGHIKALVEGGFPPYSYSWSNSKKTVDIAGLSVGKYTLTVTDRRGNVLIKQVDVQNANSGVPEPKVIVNGGGIVCAGTSAVLIGTNLGQAFATYRWYTDPATSATAEGVVFLLENVNSDTTIWAQTLLNGCSSALVKVAIKVQKPNAAFGVAQGNSINEGDLVQFIPVNQQAGNKYLWRFGDGGWSSRIRPFYIYNQPGTYAVQLTLTDLQGCQNTLVKEAWMEVKRLPGFAPNPEPSIESINLTQSKLLTINVFPNPFHQDLLVEINNEKQSVMQLECFDLWGHQLWKESLRSVKNLARYNIGARMLNCTAGVYTLRLIGDKGENRIIQIVKQ